MRYYLLLLSIYSIPFTFIISIVTNNWSWMIIPIIIFGIYFGLGMLSAYYYQKYWDNPITQESKGD